MLFLAPVRVDPFAQLKASPKMMFLRDDAGLLDHGCLPIGLKEFVAAFLGEKRTFAEGGMARLEAVPNGKTWEGCIGVGRLSFFRSAAYLELGKHVFDAPERWRHRWSEQVFYPLALAALAGEGALGDLEVVTAGCHGDYPGSRGKTLGRMHCENGRRLSGLVQLADAVQQSGAALPQHIDTHSANANNFGACSLECAAATLPPPRDAPAPRLRSRRRARAASSPIW